MSQIPELGVGIAGYGFIGKVHAHAHRSLPIFYDPIPARTRLIGVCTATEDSGRKGVEQAGFEFATTKFQDLLSRDDIQIIHICTPNDVHFPQVVAALGAGKHIYCDKPLARTVDEARKIAELASQTNVIHRMTFNYRYIPATLRAKEIVEDGLLGEVYQFRAAYLHAGNTDPNRPFSWRMNMARSGGGAIMDLGAHLFDLMRHLVGEFAEVNAILKTCVPDRKDPITGELHKVDVDDLAIVTARMKSGAVGVVEASRMATGVQDELRFEIHGSKRAIAFNMMDPNWLTVYDNTRPEAPLGGARGPQRIECATRYPKPYALGATKNTVGWPHFHIHCLYDFIDSISKGALGSPSFEDGLAAQEVVAACQKSADTGRWEIV